MEIKWKDVSAFVVETDFQAAVMSGSCSVLLFILYILLFVRLNV